MSTGTLLGEERLAGEVAAVVFTNDATGFGVVELVAPHHGAGGPRRPGGAGPSRPRATGPLASLVPGQSVALVGRWTTHERYGPTFEAVYYEQARPRTVAGLLTFLSSGRFPGVGETLAGRLVKAFGMDIGTVVETQPERLAEVRGVSPDLATTIAQAWRDAGALAAMVQRLSAVGVPAAVAERVHRTLGDDAGERIAEDPYVLLSVRGVTWQHTEALARASGVEPLDERRLAAGAVHSQSQRCHRGGHQAIPADELVGDIARLLQLQQDDAGRALDLATDRGLLIEDRGLWYSPPDLAGERGLAAELARLLSASSRVAGVTREHEVHAELTAEQADAVRAALGHQVSVLTGGPGTGKTRTLVEVVRACEAADLRLALCAPTGRAAKRMEEVTGRGASTVHRLLEARGVPGEGFAFGYDERRRLPHDVVVADEWSMADTGLAHALVRAVGDGAHLVLVGDADQLPSVGQGAVLRDLLDPRLAGRIAASRLTRVHRQAATSRIVTLAHDVNAGSVPEPRGRMGDVFAVPERSQAIAERVAEIVAVRAPAYFGCAPADVQVLAPLYRGPAGVDLLNEVLKQRLNPARGRRAVAGFHEGDRVVQTRNDAELDVANGDIGEVVAVDADSGALEVAFPQGTVTFPTDAAGDLARAWCLTVHKSQGGEWPVVVLVVDPSHRSMLWRELVYTAISRARRGLLLVGQPGLVVEAARRTGSGARHRHSTLVPRLLDQPDQREKPGQASEATEATEAESEPVDPDP